MPTASSLDQIMESASLALARLDYLACERFCLQALALSRQNRDWPNYARILLPLQESRRQRRIIAAGGAVRLGSGRLPGGPTQWLEQGRAACLLLTHPHLPETARELVDMARRQRQYVEVLYADNPTSASRWTVCSFDGPKVHVTLDAPPSAWIDTWLNSSRPSSNTTAPASTPPTPCHRTRLGTLPADWFLAAGEALGDQALRQVDPHATGTRRIELLEECLAVVTDHEILHQRLGEAARHVGAGP